MAGHPRSRASVPQADAALSIRQCAAIPELALLQALKGPFAEVTPDLLEAILVEAARFGAQILEPLNAAADAVGCSLVDGRVRTAPGHRDAWAAFSEGGWPSIDHSEDVGGQGLPLLVTIAAQEYFDRHCSAFGMLAVPTRSAARLIMVHGDDALRAEWLAKLVSGEWGATICISEAGAGSDVQRVRASAAWGSDGWTVTGEKMWISFGDHDLTARIGHCVLARTESGKGLSLFLVPDAIDGERNGVFVRRIEEKLGLHGSPTAALGFEGARAFLLGQEGRGLAQMFVMITNMRLAVGAMGLGIAAGALDVALMYAEERKQGGPASAPPVAISAHADVQRQLFSMASRVDLLRGLLFAMAVHGDLARVDADAHAQSAALVGWLLPIVKTLGAEVAFSVSSDAIQVLGGAGYTRDWPVEQCLRDARVLSVFEGTTGIQALDLLHRQLWRDEAAGLNAFAAVAEGDIVAAGEEAGPAARALAMLRESAARLGGMKASRIEAERGATALLDLAGLAALSWIAARNLRLEGSDPASQRLRATALCWLDAVQAKAAAAQTAIFAPFDVGAHFDALRWTR